MLNTVTLTTLETLQGAFTLIAVIVSSILGITIMLKYFKYRKIEFLLVGFSWVAIVSVYWPDAISFVLILITGNSIDRYIYFFLANFLVAPIHIAWIYAVTDFIFKEKKMIIRLIFTIEAIIFEITFLVIFFTDPDSIGTQIGVFVVEWALFIDLYLLFSIALFLITGILFARQSLRAENNEIRLKGKFLIVAFILFTIGTSFDLIFETSAFSIVLARSFVITASFAFYIGFVLPEFIKKLFLKSK